MLLTLDRYLLQRLTWSYCAILSIVVTIMSLENASRLAPVVEKTDTPITLLARLMGTLVPEYLGIGIPLAAYLASALMVRSLSQHGEWQIFGALGVSPARIMLVPVILSVVAASAQLVVRLELEPHGEHSLDMAIGEIRAGLHGSLVVPGQITVLDNSTTLLSDVARSEAGTNLVRVFLRRGPDVFTAKTASLSRNAAGGFVLELRNGTLVHERGDGSRQTLAFARYQMTISPPVRRPIATTVQDRLDRLTANQLVAIASGACQRIDRQHAESALALRISNAAFCILLPWLGLAFGTPPRRKAGGAAIPLGILLIVLFLRTSVFVETHSLAAPICGAALHLLLWLVLTFAIVKYAEAKGEGVYDIHLAQAMSIFVRQSNKALR